MFIQTVLGRVPPFIEGVALVHEHLYFDMSVVINNPDRSLRDVVFVSEALARAKESGLQLVVDCSTVEIGRNVWALREISVSAGVHVVACTGRYRQAAMPAAFGRVSADDLTRTFITEIRQGIEGSGIKAGIIGEIGTDAQAFTDGEEVNFIASAVAQAETGVPVITHTPGGRFGVEQAQILIHHGADPAKICIGHVDCFPDMDYYLRLLDLGVWLGFDRAGSGRVVPDKTRIAALRELLARGHADRLLISGDVASIPRIASPRGYAYSFSDYWTAVTGSDVRDELFHQVFRHNPIAFLGQAEGAD